MKAIQRALYRGKRIDNGEWVEGNLVQTNKGWTICWAAEEGMHTYCYVRPETVGRWTGLEDKNGVKIFEGDLVKVTSVYDFIERTHEVKWYGENDYPAFDLEGWDSGSNALSEAIGAYSATVTGNIHDNE